MRECKWYKDRDCYIDMPDSIFPCIVKGDLDKCLMQGLDGKPLKDSDYCVIKE